MFNAYIRNLFNNRKSSMACVSGDVLVQDTRISSKGFRHSMDTENIDSHNILPISRHLQNFVALQLVLRYVDLLPNSSFYYHIV